MSTNSNRAILALSITAALAFPVAAAGHGKGAQHGQKSHGHSADGVTHGGKGKHMRALVVKGTVKAVGDGTIQVTVARANHHGRALRGQDVTFDVSQSRIVVADSNGDGSRDLADVAVGDRVVVKARIAKGETPDPAATIAAKQVVDKSAQAAADSGDTGDDAGQPATDTTP